MNILSVGIVEANYDKDHPGMVKVSLPVLSEEGDTLTWMPVLSPYAGGGQGIYWMPEPGDSVVVGFLDDARQNAVVLGAYWNGKNAVPDTLVSDKNENKAFVTKKGHSISFSDADDGSISVTTAKGLALTLTDKDKKIAVTGKSGKAEIIIDGDGTKIAVTGDSEITLKGGDIKLEGNNITIKGSGITLKADNAIKLEGQTAEIKGTTSKLGGTNVEVNGSTVKVESSSILTLKGSMTKIN